MRRRFWPAVGVLLTVAMVILSALINYNFGYTLGTTELNARIFGTVSVVAVGVTAVLPLRISTHWEARHTRKAVLGAGMFGILMLYAVASSIGFGMQNRSQLAGSGETLAAQLKDQLQDRDQAVNNLKSLGDVLPVAALAAQIDASKKDRRWDQTNGCADATATSSRDFCQGIDRVKGQLHIAATGGALREKIEKLNLSIEKLRMQGAGQIGDPQSFGFAILLGMEQDSVRVGLSVLLALVIESVCCFGLLVIVEGHRDASGISLPEWIGRWLTHSTLITKSVFCTE